MDIHRKPSLIDYQNALRGMETFQDITPDSVMKVAQLAQQYADRRTIELIKVGRIMSTPVFTVTSDTPMTDAAHQLVANQVSGLPVVDKDQVLRGIVTEADFLHVLGIPVQHPHYSVWQTLEAMLSHVSNVSLMTMEGGIVGDYMTRDVITALPDQDIHDVVDLMKRHKVKRIVICDEQNEVVGMVTRSNLVKLFFDQYPNSQ